jgi:hypothetical protein
MRRSLTLGSIALSILVPLTTLAAFTTPGELLMSIASKGVPVNFSEEIHGSYQNQYFISAWMSGDAQGATLNDIAMNMRMTFDFAMPDTTMRAKFQFRMKDGTLYMLPESVTGKYSNEVMDLAGNLIGKKWIAIPMDESMGMEASDPMMLSALDEIFDLSSAAGRNGGTTYTLSLKREIVQEIMKELRAQSSMHPELEAAMDALSAPQVRLVVTMDMDANDSMVSARAEGNLSIPEFKGTLKSTATMSKTPIVVTVPTNVVSMDALDGITDTLNSRYNPDPFLEEDTSWEEWEGTSFEESDFEEPALECNLAMIRKGYCIDMVRPRGQR